MFAVVKTGGKQYRVRTDDCIKVEKISGNVGEEIQLSEVLACVSEDNCLLGSPLLNNVVVFAQILQQGRDKTVIAFKKRRRQNSRKKIGHRQHFTTLQVSRISLT